MLSEGGRRIQLIYCRYICSIYTITMVECSKTKLVHTTHKNNVYTVSFAMKWWLSVNRLTLVSFCPTTRLCMCACVPVYLCSCCSLVFIQSIAFQPLLNLCSIHSIIFLRNVQSVINLINRFVLTSRDNMAKKKIIQNSISVRANTSLRYELNWNELQKYIYVYK